MGAKASTESRPRTYSGSDPANGPATSGGAGGGASTSAAITSSVGHHHHHHHHHHHSFRSGNGTGFTPTGSASSSALLQGPSTSAVRARSYSSSAVHNPQAAGIIELGSRINSFASGIWPISGLLTLKNKTLSSFSQLDQVQTRQVCLTHAAAVVDCSVARSNFAQPCIPACHWSFNNNVSPTAPPMSPSSTESTWAIAYNENAQQPYGVKCPICNKSILPDDIEVHLVMCLTRPRLNYNEDYLEESKGDECVICLEELEAGQVIARLPCLCVYHKHCIDEWFQINRSCPEHPNN